jgi:hypothetical protein
MNNNLFSFGDTFWLQNRGTAMGTPAAPLYSISTYGQHENNQILNRFSSNLVYYRCFIDDIFGVWLETNDEEAWPTFKKQLNPFGDLEWNVKGPPHS